MQSVLHITTKVLPGNRIEVQLSSLLEGEEVEVFVVLPQSSPTSEPFDQNAWLDQMAQALENPEEITP